MQRERNTGSFPEPIDLNQGSISNNSAMDRSSSWDNMLSPVENRLSNYLLEPADGNPGCSDDANDDTCHNFSSWARGESSSGANNTRGGDDSKTNLGWPSSLFTSCSGHAPDSENWSFEPPSNTGTASSEPLSMQNYRAALRNNSNDGHTREQIPTFYASSSNNIGAFTSSSSASTENNSTWGSSCKRKALEGTSGQFYPPGGSSPSNQNIMHHHSHIPDCYASRGNLSISSGPSCSSPTNYSEQITPSHIGAGARRHSPGIFPSSSGLAQSPARNLSSRSNHGQHEPVLFETPRGISSSSRNSVVYSSPSTTHPNGALDQSPHPMHVNEARGIYPYTWNGQSFNTRASGSSEEAAVTNIRTSSSRRNINLEYPPNVTQDQIDWSFAPGNSTRLSSRNHSSSSGSRVGSSSSSSAWLRHHQNPNHQRLTEGSGPWVPLHASGTESGTRRSHYLAHLPSSSSSSLEEMGPSSRGQRRLDQRSAAGFLLDAPGEDINGWRSLSAVEGRHRLIRHVLTAMRRGVHLQGEEYMLVDPFMNGFAELHDRHRDMRLDVDNMSYEELLALEDRIGSVSTGLSEERIRSSIKQRKFESFCVLPNMEPCCICQENYISGDDIGILDCGHEFHTGCVEQWLTQKNICPICKMTALET